MLYVVLVKLACVCLAGCSCRVVGVLSWLMFIVVLVGLELW